MIGKPNHRNQHGAFHLQSLHERQDPIEYKKVKTTASKDTVKKLLSHTSEKYQYQLENNRYIRNRDFHDEFQNASSRLYAAVSRLNEMQKQISPPNHLKDATPFQLSCKNFTFQARCEITKLSCKQKHSCLFYSKK